MRRAVAFLVAIAVGAGTSATGSAQEQPLGRDRRPIERVGQPLVPRQVPKTSSPSDEIARAAAEVREAWFAHDAAKIVANSPELVVALPGADPSAALSRRQAAALLADFLSTSREVDLAMRHAKEVEPGRGYAELVRRYRVNGTQDVRTQSLYLGYRRDRQGWILFELRAIEP